MTCAVCGKPLHQVAFLGWKVSEMEGCVEAVCTDVCLPWLTTFPPLFREIGACFRENPDLLLEVYGASSRC